MVERVRLSERKLLALRPAKPGTRYEIMDTVRPRLGVRVTDNGHRSFVFVGRFPGSANPTRRLINATSLAEAREIVDAWEKLLAKGIDPRDEERKQRREALRRKADTFDGAVEKYAQRVLAKQRRGHIVARELRTFYVERWKGRPITSIERRDVLEVINDALDRGAPYQAHALLGNIRSFFNWAVATEDYGLEHSPCDRIKPKVVIGERKPRQRVLDDAEIKAFWAATGRMGYPFGPLFRLLLLTGARKSEIAEARRCELDTKKRLLTIPPERFKSGAQHLIPLTDPAWEIIEALPSFAGGDYLFSAVWGRKPVSGFGGAKERLDAAMKKELGGRLAPFRTHDLRRTVRTRLAGLRVADAVAEMVIGHGRKGIQRVYDVHSYEAEMREALTLWATRLCAIVEPPPANVVELHARA